MSTRRQRRVNELLQRELSTLIQFKTRDPRLSMVTVTGVEVTADLKLAKVFVAAYGSDVEIKEILQGLARAKNYLRRELAQVVQLRHIPDLMFKYDTSIENAFRINSLLDQIKEDENLTTSTDQKGLENPSDLD